MLPFLLASALALAPIPVPAVNLIAPYPAASLKSTNVISNTMGIVIPGRWAAGHSQVGCDIDLLPQQSLMAEIRSVNAGHFQVLLRDLGAEGLPGAHITRVGGKVFLINRLHRHYPHVACVVEADSSVENEPYELVLAEIDTERALAGDKPAEP